MIDSASINKNKKPKENHVKATKASFQIASITIKPH
jgi:hypothetical protein